LPHDEATERKEIFTWGEITRSPERETPQMFRVSYLDVFISFQEKRGTDCIVTFRAVYLYAFGCSWVYGYLWTW
jgi:hypothetical protein